MLNRSLGSSQPLGYLITFRTYGTWLPGDVRGSTPQRQRQAGSPLRPAHESLERANGRRLVNPPVALDASRRAVVERTVAEVCAVRQWVLGAVAVRAEHVHVVVVGESAPERMMVAFKAWSTRRMREEQLVSRELRVWSRHGSTRYLTSLGAVEAACAYVKRHASEH